MSYAVRVLLLLLATGFCAVAADLHLRGDLGIHDPSTIIKCKDRYYIFGTAHGISSKWSTDKVFWNRGPAVFASPPSWTANAVPGFDGIFWAPDIIQLGDRYCLYYSVSSWGSQVSAIGMVSTPTLDPEDPQYKWTDHGVVIASQVGSPFNTIDPSVLKDGSGNPWLCFGSYWSGIYLVQLDPVTGMHASPDSPTYHLAWNSSIEAACLYRRGPYYYLFVNYGSCCDGVNSGYNVRIGRSQNITGPYLDRSGRDLRQAGNTVFMKSTGKFTGPGHVAIHSENGNDYFSYHYYDAGDYSPFYQSFGTAKFDIRKLRWTGDGWPVFTNDWSAIYDFQNEALDLQGQYSGLLRGSAVVEPDATYTNILTLNGSGGYVDLPAGVANARTFEAVVKWNGGGAWQRIFDFGTDTSNYLMLTPSSGQGRLRSDMRVAGTTYVLEAPTPLPVGVWTHVAATFDGSRGILYVNGNPVSTNHAIPASPFETRAQTNHLGRSKFPADPNFSGSYAAFRVHSSVLSQAQLLAPRVLLSSPTTDGTYPPGNRLYFQGSATDFMGRHLPASNLTWRIERVVNGVQSLIVPQQTGTAEGYVLTDTNTTGFYRVNLTARDTSSRTSTAFVEVHPQTNGPAGQWGAFYPFQTDARDASNRLHGVLVGGASIQSDASRGNVLNLSGSSQYVSLPAAASHFQTLSGWVYWRGGASWQRVFDFGRDTEHWFFLTPRNNQGQLECAITTDRPSYLHVLQPKVSMPVDAWTHLALTLNGREAILYMNGRPIAVNNAINLFPSDIAATRSWIGRSMYPADAYLNGKVDALRLDSEALSPAQIFGPVIAFTQPSSSLVFSGGEQISYSATAADYIGNALPQSSLSWTAQLWADGFPYGESFVPHNGRFEVGTQAPFTTNLVLRLQATAMDAQGRTTVSQLELQPKIVPLELDTLPSGLALSVNGVPFATPATIPVVQGFQRHLSASESLSQNGTNYSFIGWTGSAEANYSFSPSGPSTLIASYLPPSLLVQTTPDHLTFSWPDWAAHLVLHSTTNLTSGNWIRAENTILNPDGSVSVSISGIRKSMFYRLQKGD